MAELAFDSFADNSKRAKERICIAGILPKSVEIFKSWIQIIMYLGTVYSIE